jgi:hypothetical protein
MWVRVCVVGILLCQVHKLKVQRRKVKMSIWVCRCAFFLSSERTDAEMLFFALYVHIVGQCRPRTFPNHHRIVLPRSTGCYTRYEYSPRYVSPLRGSHRGSSLSFLPAHALPHVCDMHLIYDVSNRESFEALPRWLEELENYVPPEVVKIVVGNKLDKVMSSPLLSSPSSFPADR